MSKRKMFLLAGVTTLVLTGVAGLAAAEYGERHHRDGKGMGRHIFKTFDQDGDGAITVVEVENQLAKAISEHDQDGSNSLTVEEFKALWLSHTKPRMVRSFQRLDEDGDGEITQIELEETFIELHARFDKNDDGEVTKGEIRHGYRHKRKHHDDDDDDGDN